jgi:hypothetical protein
MNEKRRGGPGKPGLPVGARRIPQRIFFRRGSSPEERESVPVCVPFLSIPFNKAPESPSGKEDILLRNTAESGMHKGATDFVRTSRMAMRLRTPARRLQRETQLESRYGIDLTHTKASSKRATQRRKRSPHAPWMIRSNTTE